MNMKRMILALVMSAVLVLTMMPAMAFAEGTAETLKGSGTEAKAAGASEESYPVPVSAEFSGLLYGVIGTNIIDELYVNNFGITVQYSDGTEKFFECLDYKYKDKVTGDIVKGKDYLLEGGDPARDSSYAYIFLDDGDYKFKAGFNKVTLLINAPYVISGEGTDDEVVAWETLSTDTNVMCNYDEPVSITFKPAKGFVPNAYIGYNYVNEETFYGKGNMFEVEYKRRPVDPEYPDFGYTAQFKYVKKKTSDGIVEGFYDNGNINYQRLDLTEGVVVYLKKGNNKITLPYSEFIHTLNKEVKLKFKYNLKVTRHDAYANMPIFEYTGKAVSKKEFAKKLVVRNTSGKKIPAKAYTYSWKKHKSMGWYTVTIKFKEKNKYTDSIVAYYGIGPKAPKVTKVKGNKKSLTVSWKKFTKSQLKKIDGMYIEVATDKNFTQNYKSIKISKKAIKKSKKTISKLKSKKKYYVRMSTYKKIKRKGVKFAMDSAYSNVLGGKTK